MRITVASLVEISGAPGGERRKGVLARPRVRALALALVLLGGWGWSPALGAEGPGRPSALAFEENRGQVDPRVRFLARAPGYVVFLTATEAVLTLRGPRHERAVVRMRVAGADPAPEIRGGQELPGRVSYVRTGATARQVAAPTYASVRYRDVRPGVDLVFHGNGRQLEYDLVLAPGADPGQIALAFDGVEGMQVAAGGDLVGFTAAGPLRQPRPVAYQEVDGARRPVDADYVVERDGRVRFRVGAYDASRPLVIDPVLSYATHLGGSDEEGDWLWGAVFGIAVDAAGNAYVTGATRSVDFPTTAGADGTLGGDQDVFVTKLSPAGAVLYSTYLGGPCADLARDIAVDAAGSAYVTGRAHGGVCLADVTPGVLVAKLDPAGALVYSFVFGGSLADTSMGQAIAVDAAGRAHVTGTAHSSSLDFPATPGAYRTEECDEAWASGTADGFVARVNAAGAALEYSTFLCGSGHDSPNDIAVDAGGHAYVAGSTGSSDFPTVNPLQGAPGGGVSAVTGFLSKLSPDGSGLVYSTYLGGSVNDVINGLALDAQGNVYLTGETESSDFPTTPGVLQEQPGNRLCYYELCTDAFVTKVDAAGSAIVYSTYLFGEISEAGSRIAVDGAGNAYVIGTTTSGYFPILDAFQTANRGLADAFVAKLDPDGTRLVYSSYLGGSHSGPSALTGWDTGSAIAVDSAGNAYVAGHTLSYDFPTTPGAFQPDLGGGICDYYDTPCGDAFVARITASGPGVTPSISLNVTPAEVAPGGTLTATWAGIPAPSAADELRLYTLGSLGGSFDHAASWPTTGAGAGTVSLALPGGLAFGTYELRLLSPNPDAGNLLGVIARSRPIRLASAAPDLVVAGIAMTPAQPAAGQPVAVTVTVTNQGAGAAAAFAVDFHKSLATAPGAGVTGDVRCAVAGLAPAASAQCAGAVTYAAAGTFSAWAQVDTARAVAESDEGNNVAGPRQVAVSAAGPDLAVISVGPPPATAAPGSAFAATDTVRNLGGTGAGQSVTRFYLSLDAARSAGDTLLGGSRTVTALAAGAQSAGTASVKIPLSTPPGTYHLLGCADDTGLVAEASETNNCLAAGATIVIGRPDLVETAVTNPPAAARPGASFAVTDTVRNQGVVSSGSSKTRYYLSADGRKGSGDTLLTGTGSAAGLAPGAAATHTVAVTIPAATAPGTYLLLACADDTKLVVEGDEGNNCRASAAAVVVAKPDLVQRSASSAGGPFRRGTAFTVSDTVLNDSPVSTPKSTTTRYYLSVDSVRNTGDVRLTGSRTVPVLAPSATSSGSVSVTIPATTLPRTYVLLACADDTKAVAESGEANNCRASGTVVAVSP
jgi:subtilase family serine protease